MALDVIVRRMMQIDKELSPARWAGMFFAVCLGQFGAWIILFYLMGVEREALEQRMYFMGFTVVPLIVWLTCVLALAWQKRAGRSLMAMAELMIQWHLLYLSIVTFIAYAGFYRADSLFNGILKAGDQLLTPELAYALQIQMNDSAAQLRMALGGLYALGLATLPALSLVQKARQRQLASLLVYGLLAVPLILLTQSINAQFLSLSAHLKDAAQSAGVAGFDAPIFLSMHLPLLLVVAYPLVIWGGDIGKIVVLVAGASIFSIQFLLPMDVNLALIIGLALAVATLLVYLPGRAGRWFDVAFAILVLGLCINLGFPYDQYHYHSGWLATLNAMWQGQTLMVDVFSQRGFLSLVSLAGIFSLVPLSYASMSLFLSVLLALYVVGIYSLLRWLGVRRWLASVSLLGALALHLYFNARPLGALAIIGYSPLRLGLWLVMAGAVAWRLHSQRRSAYWLERAVFVGIMLWSLDSAVGVALGYIVLTVYEAYQGFGISKQSLVYVGRRLGQLVVLTLVCFGVLNLYLLISTGSPPRWDYYWGFISFHEDHEYYQRPVDFWTGWWINGLPLLAGGVMIVAKAFLSGERRSPARDGVVLFVAVAGTIQLYHYVTNSVFVMNHIFPAAVTLAYVSSWVTVPRSQTIVRYAWLTGVMSLWLIAMSAPQLAATWHQFPSLWSAIPRLIVDGLAGRDDTLQIIDARWRSFQNRQFMNYYFEPNKLQTNPQMSELVDLVRAYTSETQALDLYMAPDPMLHALLLLERRHRYPITFPPHDSRVPALVEQIVAEQVGHASGDIIYVANAPIDWNEATPLMPRILANLCQQFDFEVLETSPSGINVIRLQAKADENRFCLEQDWGGTP